MIKKKKDAYKMEGETKVIKEDSNTDQLIAMWLLH